MKYMMLIAGEENAERQASDQERAAMYERIGAWWGQHVAAGKIVEGHELQPSSTATTVRIGADGGSAVTDGPFLEAKEMVGGYAVLDVADLDEALAIASTWPGASATLEIRPVVERGD